MSQQHDHTPRIYSSQFDFVDNGIGGSYGTAFATGSSQSQLENFNFGSQFNPDELVQTQWCLPVSSTAPSALATPTPQQTSYIDTRNYNQGFNYDGSRDVSSFTVRPISGPTQRPHLASPSSLVDAPVQGDPSWGQACLPHNLPITPPYHSPNYFYPTPPHSSASLPVSQIPTTATPDLFAHQLVGASTQAQDFLFYDLSTHPDSRMLGMATATATPSTHQSSSINWSNDNMHGFFQPAYGVAPPQHSPVGGGYRGATRTSRSRTHSSGMLASARSHRSPQTSEPGPSNLGGAPAASTPRSTRGKKRTREDKDEADSRPPKRAARGRAAARTYPPAPVDSPHYGCSTFSAVDSTLQAPLYAFENAANDSSASSWQTRESLRDFIATAEPSSSASSQGWVFLEAQPAPLHKSVEERQEESLSPHTNQQTLASGSAELQEAPTPGHTQIMAESKICPVCTRKFNRPCDVLRHLKSYKGKGATDPHHFFRVAHPDFQVVFPCTEPGCGEVFTRNDVRKRHTPVHEKARVDG
ncbi:hypothetical protein OF83DRAFT_1084318 [Amylostereum chailletii]|nr:hypothetical protein OF83DRAFT_1084318 [Amylostereum chailletii]